MTQPQPRMSRPARLMPAELPAKSTRQRAVIREMKLSFFLLFSSFCTSSPTLWALFFFQYSIWEPLTTMSTDKITFRMCCPQCPSCLSRAKNDALLLAIQRSLQLASYVSEPCCRTVEILGWFTWSSIGHTTRQSSLPSPRGTLPKKASKLHWLPLRILPMSRRSLEPAK